MAKKHTSKGNVREMVEVDGYYIVNACDEYSKAHGISKREMCKRLGHCETYINTTAGYGKFPRAEFELMCANYGIDRDKATQNPRQYRPRKDPQGVTVEPSESASPSLDYTALIKETARIGDALEGILRCIKDARIY